jgi:hypothetical protein
MPAAPRRVGCGAMRLRPGRAAAPAFPAAPGPSRLRHIGPAAKALAAKTHFIAEFADKFLLETARPLAGNAMDAGAPARGGIRRSDPKKALVPPPIVVEYWTVSHAKRRKKAADVFDAMKMNSYEEMIRARGSPILDTIVRLTASEQWDATLKQILEDADVFPGSRNKR